MIKGKTILGIIGISLIAFFFIYQIIYSSESIQSCGELYPYGTVEQALAEDPYPKCYDIYFKNPDHSCITLQFNAVRIYGRYIPEKLYYQDISFNVEHSERIAYMIERLNITGDRDGVFCKSRGIYEVDMRQLFISSFALVGVILIAFGFDYSDTEKKEEINEKVS